MDKEDKLVLGSLNGPIVGKAVIDTRACDLPSGDSGM